MYADIEEALAITECLDCLTPRQRQAVELWALNYSFREIGETMEISTTAAYYLYLRATDRLNKNGYR